MPGTMQTTYALKAGITEAEKAEIAEVSGPFVPHEEKAGIRAGNPAMIAWGMVEWCISAAKTPEGQAILTALEGLLAKGLLVGA